MAAFCWVVVFICSFPSNRNRREAAVGFAWAKKKPPEGGWWVLRVGFSHGWAASLTIAARTSPTLKRVVFPPNLRGTGSFPAFDQRQIVTSETANKAARVRAETKPQSGKPSKFSIEFIAFLSNKKTRTRRADEKKPPGGGRGQTFRRKKTRARRVGLVRFFRASEAYAA